MKALLVAPQMPMTYWSFQYSMRFIGKRASQIPLGLVTVAALLPRSWELRLVDTNVRRLRDRDLRWANVVLVGGMLAQLDSIQEITRRASALGRPVVVGGPVTTSPDDLEGAAVIFQGEAEGRVGELVRALEQRATDPVVVPPTPGVHPDLASCPVPRFDLLELERYASMAVQYSRGCPFNCEFCDVIELFGRRPRVKPADLVLAELEALLDLGYRGSLFVVDDNFIGNRASVRRLLPHIAAFQELHDRPFELYTEASVDLATDDGLVEAMVGAGFNAVFLGLETPSAEALASAHKHQNLRTDLVTAVTRLTRAGLQVMGGFIVGFDADGPGIFEMQRRLIASLPVPTAMVGVLSALPGTALWQRLAGERRLRCKPTGDQFGRPNFRPTMDEADLLSGYAELLQSIYSAKEYYRRCADFIEHAGRSIACHRRSLGDVGAFIRATVRVGILGRRQLHYWRLMARTLVRAPHRLRDFVALAIKGEHLIRYTEEHVIPRIQRAIDELEPACTAAGR